MKFAYDTEKDVKLRAERFISFDEIIVLIEDGHLLDVLEHPNHDRYSGQKIYVIDIDDYVWLVPHVQNANEIFLKTAFPSRKHTRHYKEGKL